jgi:multidrug efflux pump subunit AcrB
MNRSRAIPVFANVKEGQSQQAVLVSLENYAKSVLPPGYKMSVTGTAQTFRESFNGLLFALILGIIVSYMVLASQFNSFIHPVSVLLALPFSLTGAFLSLFLFHQSINLFSMIGLILLMGIVKKNSILLVDFTNAKRADGLPPDEALLEACPIRLRPILMTSFATVAGALPAAFAIGPGSETRIPMAISIVGGVLVSTLLTLFVIPCAYSFFTRFERLEAEIPS